MAWPRALARPSSDVLVSLAAIAALQLDLWLLEGVRDGVVVTVVSAIVFGGALVWRRSRPVVMVAAASVVVAAQASLGGELTTMLTTAAVAMLVTLSAGLHLPRREAALGLLGFVAASWMDLVLAADSDYSLPSDLVFTAVVVGAGPWLAGRALRERRQRAEELERLAGRLEEEREQRAQVAVLDERARIAREMHDVVAHSVSLMVVQAGAARRMLDEAPERSRAALHSVEDAGRQALGELRRAVGVLRGGPEPAALTPQPGTAQIPELVERTRASGMPVDFAVSGEPRPIMPGRDLAAYRIVQEALTNAVKHAGPARARVDVRWGARALELAVVDDGRGPNGTASPGGHGLIGMRERVAVYGGTVETGGGPGGGYAVRARIPLDERPAEAVR